MAEKDNTLKLIISVFVVVILALAFITVISDQTARNVQQVQATDTLNLATFGGRMVNGTVIVTNTTNLANYNTKQWKQDTADCDLVPVSVTNATGIVLIRNTDYTLTTDGTFAVLNSAKVAAAGFGNVTTVVYTYCSDDYVNSSWGRAVLGSNVGILAIAILIIVLATVYVLFGRKENDD